MNQTIVVVTITTLALIIAVGGIFFTRILRQATALKTKYGTIADVDGEVSARKARAEDEVRARITAAESQISASQSLPRPS